MISLGPFELRAPVGRGASGVVWAARHRRSGVQVALKVLTSELARTHRYVAAFEDEVRTLASLDHPAITWVFDAGICSEGADWLVPNSPWLAMELAAGTVDPWCGGLDWARQRAVLDRVLSALAHAHARGVVHLDVKPANVLVGCPTRGEVEESWESGIRLADFSIAQAVGTSSSLVGGTPLYMAPEQLRADRNIGSAADLYAVGALGWALATGAPPFADHPRPQEASVRLPPPAFTPARPVPEGLEAWLRRLLQKHPLNRYRHAAEARRALADLGGAAGEEPRPTSGTNPLATGRPAPTLVPHARPWAEATAPTILDFAPVLAPAPADPAAAAPLPPAEWSPWQPEIPVARPHRFDDAGLGLFFSRPGPVAGRERERTALWEALGEVTRTRSARVLALTGDEGMGKTRLADWVARRAEEEGLASVLRLSEPLERSLTALFADAEDLPPWVVEGLATGGEAGRAAARAVLRRAAEVEPLVLVVDDAAGPAVAFAVGLLREEVEESTPALLVLTTRDASLVAPLRGMRGATVLDLAPLPDVDVHGLIRGLLPLEHSLASTLVARAGNNPREAVELVAEQVREGRLTPGSGGFELAEGATVAVPAALEERWARRLGRLEPRWRILLERAAAAGQVVDLQAWAESLGQPIPNEALRRFSDLGLLSRGPRPRFSSRVLVELLVREAEAAGRLPEHCRCWLGPLAARGGDPVALARLHVGAGQLEEAWDVALTAARELRERGELVGAWEALELLEGLLAADPRPRRVAELATALAWYRHARSEHREMEAEANQLLLATDAWDDLAADALFLLGRNAQNRGRRDEADPLLHRSRQRAVDAGDERRAGWACLALGTGARARGELPAAVAWATEAERVGHAVGDPSLAGAACRELSLLSTWRGDPAAAVEYARRGVTDDARKAGAMAILAGALGAVGKEDEAFAAFEAAIVQARRTGFLHDLAPYYNGLAEILRRQGRFEEADRLYATAEEWAIATGIEPTFIHVNRGLVALARGRPEDVRPHADRALATAPAGTLGWLATQALRAAAAAALGDEPAWRAADAVLAPHLATVRQPELVALVATAREEAAARGW